MADEVVRSRFEAETSGYVRGVETAAKATDKLADSADKASKSAEQAGQRQERAAQNAAKAQDKSADAAGRLRVAQQKLNDARASGDTARIVAAEEGVAKAQRDVERTAQEAASAQDALQQGLNESGNEADQSTTKFQRLSKAVTDHRGDMEQVGTSLIGIGAGLTAVSVGAGKAAMDWESAWAGVMKTNDGTSQQTQKLEQDLRNLTGVLPATHAEIAGVAEAAGQLGVGIDDVAGFSEVMLNLGETTNLSADEAATALARFSNIMGTSLSDADRLGSTIVGLGNNFATTESEIVGMSMRIAGVGRQLGMAESDVFALATAMSSVGVEAEAGGTAISNTMKKIDASVREGGDSLTGWAEAAGVSAQEFAAQWEADPARAMVTLTENLGEVNAAGGDVNGMLSDLGVNGIRESDTLIRLAGASGVLSEALDEGASAWEENIALAEEAELRYETTESKIAIAWNQIKDAAIDAGGAILPVVATVAEGAAGIASAFAALPDPVKGALGVLSGVAGVALLGAGGLLTLAPRVMETAEAFGRLGTAFPKAAGAFRGIAKWGGIATGAAVGISALSAAAVQIHNAGQPAAVTLEEVANQLSKVQESSEASDWDELFDFKTAGVSLSSFSDALDLLDPETPAEHLNSFGASVMGVDNNTAKAIAAIEKMDQLFATLDPSEAAEQMNQLRIEQEQLGNTDLSHWSSLKELFPEYAAGIEEAAAATGIHATDTELMLMAMGDIPPKFRDAAAAAEDSEDGMDGASESMEDAAAAAEELQEAIDAAVTAIETMGSESRTVQAANDAYQASIDSITESLKENGQTLDNTTDAGRANREELRGLADTGTEAAARMGEFGLGQEEVQAQLQGTYEQLVAAGEGFGLGATEAEAMAREILEIPPGVDVETWMSSYAAEVATLTAEQIEGIPEGVHTVATMSDEARAKAFETAASIDLIPGYKFVDVAVDDNGDPAQIQSRVNAITGKTEYVRVSTDGTHETVQAQIINIDGKDVPVYVSDNGTITIVEGDIAGIPDGDSTIWAEASTSGAESALNHAARDRWSTIIQTVSQQQSPRPYYTPFQAEGGLAGIGPFPKHAEGRLPKHAMGRLPYTGLGTDRILGVNSMGTPVAMVDDGEGIIRESSTRKHLGLLGMVNDDDPRVGAVGRMLGLPGYAGGNVGREWGASSVASQAVHSGPVSASVDSGMIAAAVSNAMSGWTPMVNVGGRPFYGVMKQVESQYGGR